MKLDLRAKGLSVGLALGALVALGAMSGGAAAAEEGPSAAAAAKCNKAKNVEAIIDDSGSMSWEDPSRFRTKLLEAFVGIGANNGRILGGGSFADGYTPLFGPAAIPGVNGAMTASFAQLVDDGTTNYEAAFAGATAHNPGAEARIFLTDGDPNAYPSSHLSPLIKTYVIGLGSFAASSAGFSTLSQLAAETGGPAPFLVSDPSQVQPVAGAVTAGLECKRIQTFTDQFNRQGQAKKHGTKAKGKAMDILTTWPGLTDAMNLSVRVVPRKSIRNRSVASAAKVKIKRSKGTNFATVRIKGLKKGQKVRIKVKAKALAAPSVVTTQVIK